MNVYQLIQKLSAFHPNIEVYFSGPDSGGYDATLHSEVGIRILPTSIVIEGIDEGVSDETFEQLREEGQRTT